MEIFGDGVGLELYQRLLGRLMEPDPQADPDEPSVEV